MDRAITATRSCEGLTGTSEFGNSAPSAPLAPGLLMDGSQDERLMQLLVGFAQTLGTDYSMQRIMDHLVRRTVDILPTTGAGVTIGHRDEDLRLVAASAGLAATLAMLHEQLREGARGQAYRKGVPVSAPYLRRGDHAPHCARAPEQGLAAFFSFPMRLNGGCVGTLDLYRDTPGPLDGWSMRAGQVLADVTAAYLYNAQSRVAASETLERLSHDSLHDPLTGLANRALFEQLLDQAAARSRRSDDLAAVLFLDLDRFKPINDQHGHLVGDDLLVAVARRIEAALRSGDTLARFGGDEFMALCEDLSGEPAAEGIGDRIVDVMAEPFTIAGRVISVTASVGIAVFGRGASIHNAVMRDADSAMYAAKANGGGRHLLVAHRPATQVLPLA